MSASAEKIAQSLVEDKTLRSWINHAVDLSATMNNCFFHAYALHLLANGLPLPDGLFTAHTLDSEDVKQLKAIIRKEADLSLFEDYDALTTGQPCQAHLVEKILVLGVLFRSWFVHRMKEDDRTMGLLFNDTEIVKAPFYFVLQRYDTDDDCLKENIRRENIYPANRDFFNSPQLQSITPRLAWDFWTKTGYTNYLRYLNQPQVKLSVHEIEFILRCCGIGFTIYEKSKARLILDHKHHGQPQLALAIHTDYEHFYLLANEGSEALLKTYAEAYQQSLDERTALLRRDGHNKVSLAKKSPFLLLAVTLPEAALPAKKTNLLALLVERLNELKAEVSSRQAKKHPALLLSKKYPNFGLLMTSVPRHPLDFTVDLPVTEPDEKARLPCQTGTVSAPRAANRLRLTEQEVNYAYALYNLKLKALQFKALSKQGTVEKYRIAREGAEGLHQALQAHFDDFLHSTKQTKDYNQFRRQSLQKIDQFRSLLETHRGLGHMMMNAVLAILGIGVIYLALCCIRTCTHRPFFFKPPTDTATILRLLEEGMKPLEREPEREMTSDWVPALHC